MELKKYAAKTWHKFSVRIIFVLLQNWEIQGNPSNPNQGSKREEEIPADKLGTCL